MGRVNLNASNLKSEGMTYLKESLNAVNKALSYFEYFNIPYDFAKREKLLSVKDDLREISKDLESVKNWIVNSNESYNNLIEKLNDRAEKLPSNTLKTRNTII